MMSLAKTLSSRALNALSVPDAEEIIPLVIPKKWGWPQLAGSLYSLSICVNMVHHDIVLYSKDNYKGR